MTGKNQSVHLIYFTKTLYLCDLLVLSTYFLLILYWILIQYSIIAVRQGIHDILGSDHIYHSRIHFKTASVL